MAQRVAMEGRLLEVPFHSVSDYLHLLKDASVAASPAGSRVMFLLAAAVSDFYIPPYAMVLY
jgi:phosphopantothenate-cysteine ligase